MDAETVVPSLLHPACPAADPPRRGHRRRRLVVLAIALVVVLAVGAAAIVMPGWRASRLNANESMAIAMLKNISSAQAQMQACGAIDVDGNGAGEYGFFAELAGAKPVRSAPGKVATKVDPPILGAAFGHVVGGRVHLGGYVFQMFLQDKDGRWVGEAPDGGSTGVPVDAPKSEVFWLCYAWPIDHGSSGKRAFLINQAGDVLATSMQAEVYSGDAGPLPGDSGHCRIDGVWNIAANREDGRGNTWVVG